MLDKAIKHGKEYRKQYYGDKAYHPACRNNGSCDWSNKGRQHRNRRREPIEYEFYLAGMNDED